MGIFIVIAVLAIQLSFAIYCIQTKNNHNDLRQYVRLGALGMFVIAILVTLIKWSFRWYGLGMILTLLAIVASIRLYTKKLGKHNYQTWRIVTRAIWMSALLTLATIPLLMFPQYKEPTVSGQLQVVSESFTYIDENRLETFSTKEEQRSLNVTFWYPEDGAGEYPLVIFSHGAFGVKMSNTSTFMELASNGYVVCSIDHPYHAAGTIDNTGKLVIGSSIFMQEVIDANRDVYSEKDQFAMTDRWMTLRKDDINFVLDTIMEGKVTSSAKVYDLVDSSNIALMGHSLGGAASAQLGRERSDIKAVINLDGSMLGEYVMNEEGNIVLSQEPYPLPILNFYSDYVIRSLALDPTYVYANQFVTSNSSRAFETYIKGSSHMSYTDLPLFSPFLANQLAGISGGDALADVDARYAIETMNDLVLQFFDVYVKGKGSFHVEASY